MGAAYLAGIVEFFGGMALIVGIFFRPVTIILAFTMIVAMSFHLSFGDPFFKYSHALESAILFIALTFTGPGKFPLDHKLLGFGAEEITKRFKIKKVVPNTF